LQVIVACPAQGRGKTKLLTHLFLLGVILA
jgi:hypothetical protein